MFLLHPAPTYVVVMVVYIEVKTFALAHIAMLQSHRNLLDLRNFGLGVLCHYTMHIVQQGVNFHSYHILFK